MYNYRYDNLKVNLKFDFVIIMLITKFKVSLLFFKINLMESTQNFITCSILSTQFDKQRQIVFVNCETDYGSHMKLWGNCLTNDKYDFLKFDLSKYTFWNIYYDKKDLQIEKFEPLSFSCNIM